MHLLKLVTTGVASLIITTLLSSCASSQGQFIPLGTAYPAKPLDAAIEVFEQGQPSRPFTRIALLDAHLEKTHFMPSSDREALLILQAQARKAGADAVIQISQQRSSIGEARIMHMSGTAIRYR